MMKIEILNKSQIETYLHSAYYYGYIDDKTYIISYYGSKEKKVNFKKCKAHVLQLNINDVRYGDEARKYCESHYSDFLSVAKFLKEAIDNDSKIICQCNAGISRSAATAKAALEFFEGRGSEIDMAGEYIPNPIFFELIMKAFTEICQI